MIEVLNRACFLLFTFSFVWGVVFGGLIGVFSGVLIVLHEVLRKLSGHWEECWVQEFPVRRGEGRWVPLGLVQVIEVGWERGDDLVGVGLRDIGWVKRERL